MSKQALLLAFFGNDLSLLFGAEIITEIAACVLTCKEKLQKNVEVCFRCCDGVPVVFEQPTSCAPRTVAPLTLLTKAGSYGRPTLARGYKGCVTASLVGVGCYDCAAVREDSNPHIL